MKHGFCDTLIRSRDVGACLRGLSAWSLCYESIPGKFLLLRAMKVHNDHHKSLSQFNSVHKLTAYTI
jgi:hypothetical protein